MPLNLFPQLFKRVDTDLQNGQERFPIQGIDPTSLRASMDPMTIGLAHPLILSIHMLRLEEGQEKSLGTHRGSQGVLVLTCGIGKGKMLVLAPKGPTVQPGSVLIVITRSITKTLFVDPARMPPGSSKTTSLMYNSIQ